MGERKARSGCWGRRRRGRRTMGRAKMVRKFAEVKRLLNPKELKNQDGGKSAKKKREEVRHVDKTPSALFFKYNSALGPPYRVIIDTNFINFSIKSKVRASERGSPSRDSDADVNFLPSLP